MTIVASIPPFTENTLGEINPDYYQSSYPDLNAYRPEYGLKLPVVTSDGSSANYYKLPPGATELRHLIGYRKMSHPIGEIFCACYRYGQNHHSTRKRDLNKIIAYAEFELENMETVHDY